MPTDLDPDELDRLNTAETARGVELVQAGAIEQIWRIRGRRANAGIWHASSPEHLDDLLASLPMRPFLEVGGIDVLDEHPVTPAASGSAASGSAAGGSAAGGSTPARGGTR